MKKIWKIIKSVSYLTAGILIACFSEEMMDYAVALVGTVMTIYAVETIIISIFKKTVLHEDNELFEGLILCLLAIVLLFTDKNNLEKVCVIWAIWSILRETEEIKECLHINVYKKPHAYTKAVNYVHIAESSVVIVLSLLMLLSPSEKTAHTHIILLGLELILEVAFPLVNSFGELIYKMIRKRKGDDSSSGKASGEMSDNTIAAGSVKTVDKQTKTSTDRNDSLIEDISDTGISK